MKVLSYLHHYIHPYGIGFAAHSLALGMNNHQVHSEIFSIDSDFAETSPLVQSAIKSKLLLRIASKFISIEKIRRYTEWRFRCYARKFDVIILWPGCSLETFQYLKRKGKIIVVESINCHQEVAKQLLSNEEQLLGLGKTHLIDDSSIRDEHAKLTLADYIFSPSPQVTKSLIVSGVDKSKILSTSYGLSPKQVLPVTKKRQHKPVFLFVGSVILRKGIHLLLEYWDKAKVDGTLMVVGKIDPSVQPLVDSFSERGDIEFIPFTADIDSMYQSADVFILPSIEEGSPLVTYLALGAGLPCLVTPMGGDGVVRDGIDGYIIDPHDKEKWISSIQKLALDVSMRVQMATNSHDHATQFLWEEVADKRRKLLINKLGL
ncbi:MULTISPECIES: glycosyltransferase family 4 protein [unclassified Methylophaga]|jgi:glycosyltransferase involved in cell wall biosynthesis|uniref:glycosyltransferase family 4 protein n=1 Tax=unclassified Methylophaga TaxID=2629249 RepID=UPI00259D192F|nr:MULTISPECIES: glycosyltransferase family 4 protein [unclassified Methylophaga]|tara:strand:- start:7530 stop:8654 length:1125 start_codon:yes stop_codon:yes gene_type:complete